MDYVTRNLSENHSLRFPDEVLPGAWPPSQHIKCKEPRKLREEAEEREQEFDRPWKVLKSVLPGFLQKKEQIRVRVRNGEQKAEKTSKYMVNIMPPFQGINLCKQEDNWILLQNSNPTYVNKRCCQNVSTAWT